MSLSTHNRTSTLKRLLYFLFFGLTVGIFLLGLAFRNELVLGSGLIIGRWIFPFLFVILFLIDRKKKWILIFCTTLFFAEIAWSQLHIKSYEATLNSKQELSFLSINLLFINKNTNGIKELIRIHSPDVLLLQEFSFHLKTSLSPTLDKIYPYKILHPRKDAYGIATYSKYPIINHQYLEQYKTLPYALITNINVKNKKIAIGNIHLESPSIALINPEKFWPLLQSNHKNRQEEYKAIQTFFDNRKDHTQIIMGDFNTMTIEPLYRKMCYDWINAFDQIGSGNSATFPNTNKLDPFLKLDHAFLRGDLVLESIEVLDKTSSDHLPLFLKIKI